MWLSTKLEKPTSLEVKLTDYEGSKTLKLTTVNWIMYLKIDILYYFTVWQCFYSYVHFCTWILRFFFLCRSSRKQNMWDNLAVITLIIFVSLHVQCTERTSTDGNFSRMSGVWLFQIRHTWRRPLFTAFQRKCGSREDRFHHASG